MKKLNNLILIIAFFPIYIFSDCWNDHLQIDLDEVRTFIKERIENAEIFTDPFPHIYVDQILPPKLYKRLQRNWPEEELINRTTQPRSARWRKIITPGEKKWCRDDMRLVWKEFSEKVVNPIIKREVATILRKYLFKRFNPEDVHSVRLCHPKNLYDHMLIQDYDYVWFPHIDQAARFAALLFYMPKEDDLSHQHMGTYIFRHKEGLQSIDVIGAAPEDVDTVRVLPYRPNSLAVIMQTPSAWHGPVFLDETGYLRRVYLSAIFLTPECMKEIYGQVFYKNASDIQVTDGDQSNSISY